MVKCVIAGAGKLIGKLQTYKIKYAEARAKEHPELSDVYNNKIKSMQAAGRPAVATDIIYP